MQRKIVRRTPSEWEQTKPRRHSLFPPYDLLVANASQTKPRQRSRPSPHQFVHLTLEPSPHRSGLLTISCTFSSLLLFLLLACGHIFSLPAPVYACCLRPYLLAASPPTCLLPVLLHAFCLRLIQLSACTSTFLLLALRAAGVALVMGVIHMGTVECLCLIVKFFP